MIWFKKYTAEEVNPIRKKTLVEHIGIEITEVGDDYLKGTMPVDYRTVQPAQILHGGASAALIETLGSIASFLVINPEEKICVGLELNINHIRSASSGIVTGIARPVHLGKTTHIWNVEITDESDKKIAVGRITMMILDKK